MRCQKTCGPPVGWGGRARSACGASAPRAARARRVAEVAKVLQQPPSVLGADRLGMELDAPMRPFPVREAHHRPVGRPRAALDDVGERVVDPQRVVTDRSEALRDPGEQRRLVVEHRADPPVDRPGRPDDRAAVDVREALVSEADTEDRQVGGRQRVRTDPEVPRSLGRPGAGGDHDIVEPSPAQLLPRRRVVAHDDRLVAVDLGDQLEQVVRVRVVVVDDERLHDTDILPGRSRLGRCPRRSSRR